MASKVCSINPKGESMKWYRLVHAVLYVASFIPLIFSLWPFWHGVALPLLVVIPYSLNEIWLDRKSKSSELLRRGEKPQSPILHAYRES